MNEANTGGTVSDRVEETPRPAGGRSPNAPAASPARSVRNIVLSYILFAGLWILFSDRFLAALVSDPEARVEWSIYKGLAFVLVTGAMLYVLIHRLASRLQQTRSSWLASEEQLQAIFDHTSLFIGLLKPDGTVIRINRSVQQFANTAGEDIAGKPCWENPSWKRSPEMQARFREAIQTASGGQVACFEAVLPDVKGELRLFDVKVTPIKDDSGQVVFLVPEGCDITISRQAEAAVRQSEALYRRLMESANDAIFVADAETGALVDANLQAQELTGRSLDEIRRMHFSELHPPEQSELCRQMFREVVSKGQGLGVKLSVRHRNGTCIPVEINASIIEAHGRRLIQGIFRNVIERERAEEALRVETQRLERASTAGKIALWEWDLTTNRLEWSSVVDSMLGYEPGAFPRTLQAWEAMIHPDDLTVESRMLAEHLENGARYDVVYRVQRKDGTYMWWRDIGACQRNGQGKPYQMSGACMDVTARKQAEEALRQSQERLERINGCILDLGTDHDANINRLTALCGELLGATCALYNRLQGDLLCSIGQWQTPPDFKAKDVPAGHICYDVIRGNRDGPLVITNLPQTSYFESDPNVRAYGLQTYMGCAVRSAGKAVGSLCVVYRTDYRPTSDDQRILGIIAAAVGNEDTRKQAEAELRRLMTAIEQVPESIMITDDQGRILYVNPAFERTTGYSRAEATAQNPRLLKSGRQDVTVYEELWTKISAGEVWRGRFVNKRKDGQFFTEDAVIAPVRDPRGKVVNYIAVKRDITRELQQEEQYLQTQKMDSIGRLAGGVAHDFNNILSVILGNAGLALLELPADHSVRGNIEEVQKSAERAANLTRQLLAFARRQIIEPRLVNLNELITNLTRMLHRLIGEDIELVTRTEAALGQVKADPGQIEQVLLNLVVNARDAMPEGGVLTLCTNNVTLDEAFALQYPDVTPGDFVMVSVSDTGAGMDEDTRQHVFEPFFTTKEQGRGTGLGLATCFGIVRQSKGHIDFDSQARKGTTFRVYLPRVRGTAVPADKGDTQLIMVRGTETILLAEDELSLRQLMARVLRAQGYTVLEAADGKEALALAQAHAASIQLLITDIVMPGLSGKTLAEWLGEINPAARVLFMSGYISNILVRDAMMKPGTFFLQKPFTPSALAKKVRAALDEIRNLA